MALARGLTSNIRFRGGNIQVTAADGEMRTAAAWGGRGGRDRVLRDALVTAERYQVGTVLCVQDKAMKRAWCLATNGTEHRGRARRWERNHRVQIDYLGPIRTPRPSASRWCGTLNRLEQHRN